MNFFDPNPGHLPLRSLAIIATILSLSGCSAPLAGMSATTPDSYAAAHDRAVLLVAIEETRGGDVHLVDSDGDFVLSLRETMHATAVLEPGHHSLYFVPQDDDAVPLSLDAEAGRTYLVWIERTGAPYGVDRTVVRRVRVLHGTHPDIDEFRAFVRASNHYNVSSQQAGEAWTSQNRSTILRRIAAANEAWSDADSDYRASHTLTADMGLSAEDADSLLPTYELDSRPPTYELD